MNRGAFAKKAPAGLGMESLKVFRMKGASKDKLKLIIFYPIGTWP